MAFINLCVVRFGMPQVSMGIVMLFATEAQEWTVLFGLREEQVVAYLLLSTNLQG